MANSLDFTKSQLEKLKQILEYPKDFKYPLGTKVVADDPEFLNKEGLGGEWERVEGAFIFGANDDYPADGVVRGSPDAIVVGHNHPLLYGTDVSSNLTIRVNGFGVGGVSSSESSIGGVGEPGTGKNMPPYIAKYMWIKTKLESETNGLLEVNV